MSEYVYQLGLTAIVSAILFSPALWILPKTGRSRWEFLFLCVPLVQVIYLYVLAWGRWPSEMTQEERAERMGFAQRAMVAGGGFVFVAWFLLGLVQLAAAFAGLKAIGLPWILAAIAGLFVAYIPVVGTGFGIYGAITAWDWEWYWAVLAFFWHIPLTFIGAAGSSIFRR